MTILSFAISNCSIISEMPLSFKAESFPYEGYTFVKASPTPGQIPTWYRVKRMPMRQSQHDYFEMIKKRATKKTALQQYQNISSNARRAHINQLIDEQRQMNPMKEWSCVYVKEHTKPSNAQNARWGDYETVSMDVIIMQRSARTTHPRPPVGSQVDLGAGFHPSLWAQRRDHPSIPGQNANLPRAMIEGPQSLVAVPDDRRESPGAVHGAYPTKDQAQRHEPKQSTAITPNLASSAMDNSDTDSDYTSHSSGGSSDSEDDVMVFDSPDKSSEADDPVSLDHKQQAVPPKRAPTRHEDSPAHRGITHGPRSRSRAKSHSRSLERRLNRRGPAREQYEASTAKGPGPLASERARSRGSVSGIRYRKQLMSDNEIRSRMLDHREASIGHRERQFKRTLYGAHQLELQPMSDSPAVCHCTCRCAMGGEDVD
ncbi:unnamed protein product [Penicillium salamii]|uniref:Uncharacterized protein n=1 Tax=Penicillium salamii TaxID=1612424 RepID=A0A9W4JTR0_9EURO|nr:unnamed protein product [Penicillium salamii]